MTNGAVSPRAMSFRDFNRASLFAVSIVFPTLGVLGYLLAHEAQPDYLEVLPWAILIAAVELLPVATWSGVQVSVSYPIIMAVAFTFDPAVAALVGLVSAFDPREFKGQVTLLRALFNRCQVCLAVLAASAVFHLPIGRHG